MRSEAIKRALPSAGQQDCSGQIYSAGSDGVRGELSRARQLSRVEACR